MNKRRYYLLALILLSIIFCFMGCNKQTAGTINAKKEQFDYCSKLSDGLQMNINKIKLDEHLICFELSYETDSDVYKRFEASSLKKDVSNCYLIHKTSNEKKYAVDEDSAAKNRLYFDDIDFNNLSEYILHIESPFELEMKSEYPIAIPIQNAETVFEDKVVHLPFNHFININKASVRNDYEKLSEKCVAIDFSVSDKNLDFDIQIDKSEISTGAAAGDLINSESDKYIYTHPINDEETEIVISFKNVCISNTFSINVEL